ncbi:hypothetical protein BpHYR1_024563 [Brachionus plicatilis]|uniref:Uncharacterized protein n=1 Tax=Brachionus plicatilis TaxID=10195 RepID=A0A3M7RAU0_BRAPC|nr:hypothetical protein BpHYR1_024563 [Brachionus plicatilis]
MITYQNSKYCVAHVKQRWLKRKKTRQNGYLVKSAQIGCNRVNRFNPFGPHNINRGAKGVTQKIRENWVTIFESLKNSEVFCILHGTKKYSNKLSNNFVDYDVVLYYKRNKH